MSDSRSHPWSTGKLGNFADVRARIGWRGLSSSEYTSEGPFLIAGQHIRSGEVSWSECDHISDRRYNESWEISLQSGDVVLTKDGTIGRVARIDCLPERATINGTMMLIRCRQELDYRYLSHYLKGNSFQHLVKDRISGSSIPHIFQRDMVQLDLPVPSLTEQRRIAEILDVADETLQSTERLIAKLELAKKGLLHDLLTRATAESGEATSLGDVSVIAGGVTLGRQISGSGSIELPYLRVANVQDGFVDTSEMKKVRILRKELERYQLRAGDVLMTEGGDFDKLGRGAVWDGSIDPCLHQNHIFRVRCDRSILLPQFLAMYSASPAGRRHFVSISKQTTNLASINMTQLKAFSIPIPSLREQSRIVRTAEAQDDEIRVQLEGLRKLRLLKRGLMDDLLTGRVRVEVFE